MNSAKVEFSKKWTIRNFQYDFSASKTSINYS